MGEPSGVKMRASEDVSNSTVERGNLSTYRIEHEVEVEIEQRKRGGKRSRRGNGDEIEHLFSTAYKSSEAR
jgi:hypothetical protein